MADASVSALHRTTAPSYTPPRLVRAQKKRIALFLSVYVHPLAMSVKGVRRARCSRFAVRRRLCLSRCDGDAVESRNEHITGSQEKRQN